MQSGGEGRRFVFVFFLLLLFFSSFLLLFYLLLRFRWWWGWVLWWCDLRAVEDGQVVVRPVPQLPVALGPCVEGWWVGGLGGWVGGWLG